MRSYGMNNTPGQARHPDSGQALTEYILLVCVIALGLYGMTKLFGSRIKLIFQQHAISLGYELPGEKYLIDIKKQLLKYKMESYDLQKEIQKRYGG